jgi:hypothetical protein
MKSRRPILVVLGILLLALATRSPGAGLFWIICGGLLVACWWLPDSIMHRSRQRQWEAALDRAAEGWPTAHDRLLFRLDRIYRGTAAAPGAFLVLYGRLNLTA